MIRYLPETASVLIAISGHAENFGIRVTVPFARHGHTLRRVRSPFRGQEIQMEIAALVLFSSVALWFADEISGNRL
jgi:hypothetical protein